MGLGVLEPKAMPKGATVPGTVQLLQSHDTKAVTLNPVPSDSPNDPLRWPAWKKHSILLTVSVGCALAGIQGTCLSVATIPIMKDVGTSLAETEALTSWSFLAIAFGCASCAVLARLIGKRPVYLFAACLGLAGAIWNALGTSYPSLVGSRIIYGVGAGIFEPLPLATIGDIYFVHERGRATAFFSFVCLGCTQLAPILGGYLTSTYGWRSQFWALTAFWAALLVLCVFVCPETAFNRESRLETDLAADIDDASTDASTVGSTLPDTAKVHSLDMNDAGGHGEKRRPYIQELKLWRQEPGRMSVLNAVLQYVLTGLYPIVWFAFLVLGSFLAWYIGINVSLAQIFGAPPIDFGPTRLGYINTFAVVGALVAEALLHTLSDSSCRWLARRNGNIYEPEFRLFLLIPAVCMTVLAFPLFGWYAGIVAQEREISWVAASVLFGMVVFTLVNGQSVAFAYLLDSHREISIEAGMFAIMLRSIWTYGASTFVPDWLVESGVAHAFYEIAGLQTGLMIIAVTTMYLYGKRVRYFMGRHNPIAKWAGGSTNKRVP